MGRFSSQVIGAVATQVLVNPKMFSIKGKKRFKNVISLNLTDAQ